ncbi:TITIN protein, partial [Ramphastos sulfuratus]|nr:TITIN protein [Ramphastos sulfuratus]
PPPPTMTVTPLKTQYLLGDTISIQCSAPWTTERVQGFQFSGRRGWAMEVRTSKRSYIHIYNITDPKEGGAQTCCYIIKKAEGPLCSQESKAIVINIKDRPPQPTLTLKPSSGLTIEGQPLVFSCTAPEGIVESRFYLYREKLKVLEGISITTEATTAQFLVLETKQSHAGNFSCGYEELTEGRWIPSYLSQVREVLIKEPAPPPHLDMDPATGVVDEDHPLQLTCKASRDVFRPQFHFYRNGLEVSPGQGGIRIQKLRNGSHMLVSRTSRSFSGNFSCGMEEDVEGTWVVAPRSRAVGVTIRAPLQLLPLVVGGLSGGIVLLLSFLLAVCLWRRQRGEVHWKDFQNKEDPSSYPMVKVTQGEP